MSNAFIIISGKNKLLKSPKTQGLIAAFKKQNKKTLVMTIPDLMQLKKITPQTILILEEDSENFPFTNEWHQYISKQIIEIKCYALKTSRNSSLMTQKLNPLQIFTDQDEISEIASLMSAKKKSNSIEADFMDLHTELSQSAELPSASQNIPSTAQAALKEDAFLESLEKTQIDFSLKDQSSPPPLQDSEIDFNVISDEDLSDMQDMKTEIHSIIPENESIQLKNEDDELEDLHKTEIQSTEIMPQEIIKTLQPESGVISQKKIYFDEAVSEKIEVPTKEELILPLEKVLDDRKEPEAEIQKETLSEDNIEGYKLWEQNPDDIAELLNTSVSHIAELDEEVPAPKIEVKKEEEIQVEEKKIKPPVEIPAAIESVETSMLPGEVSNQNSEDSNSSLVLEKEDQFSDLFDTPVNEKIEIEEERTQISLVQGVPEEGLLEESLHFEGEHSAVGVQEIDLDDIAGSKMQEEELHHLSYNEKLQADPLFENSIINEEIKEKEESEILKTIKSYSALKEREARESKAAAEALRRQLDQIRTKLATSEEERRRLQLVNEEIEVKMRTVLDRKEENQHLIKQKETQLEERVKDLSIQLDSSQFIAAKAEKKLSEYKERVRNDIQKIRSRERDLSNRLELQKRDMDALLTSKDEKLLQQKREIDRLLFEGEILKEKLVEHSQQEEGKSQRLKRALQSLKLAQGMLSSLEITDLTSFSSNDDIDSEAA